GSNYLAERAQMRVRDAHGTLAVLYPERRYYPVAQKIISSVAIHTNGFYNLYLVLGEAQKNAKGHYTGWSVRTALHPLAPWIWLGCILMALGALLALPWKKPNAPE